MKDQDVGIDGFNQIILLESTYSGFFILKVREGVCLDLSGVPGSYKKVFHSKEEIEKIGKILQDEQVRLFSGSLTNPCQIA